MKISCEKLCLNIAACRLSDRQAGGRKASLWPDAAICPLLRIRQQDATMGRLTSDHDEEGVEDDVVINLLNMMNGSPPICVHSIIWRILFFQRIFYVEGGNLIFSPISSIYQNKKNIVNLSADEGPGQ